MYPSLFDFTATMGNELVSATAGELENMQYYAFNNSRQHADLSNSIAIRRSFPGVSITGGMKRVKRNSSTISSADEDGESIDEDGMLVYGRSPANSISSHGSTCTWQGDIEQG